MTPTPTGIEHEDHCDRGTLQAEEGRWVDLRVDASGGGVVSEEGGERVQEGTADDEDGVGDGG